MMPRVKMMRVGAIRAAYEQGKREAHTATTAVECSKAARLVEAQKFARKLPRRGPQRVVFGR